jgi:hypothetical protein
VNVFSGEGVKEAVQSATAADEKRVSCSLKTAQAKELARREGGREGGRQRGKVTNSEVSFYDEKHPHSVLKFRRLNDVCFLKQLFYTKKQ